VQILVKHNERVSKLNQKPMKTVISNLFFTLVTICGFAQAYQPFPTSNAMWREAVQGFQCGCCADYQWEIDGDIVINDTTYQEYVKGGVNYIDDWFGNCNFNVTYPIWPEIAFIRNDIANKKVMIFDYELGIETTLYDFNMSVGDTVPPSFLNYYGDIVYVITEIDSVLLGGVYRKRFKLGDTWDVWDLCYIEGIGSTRGLLSTTETFLERSYRLDCFAIDAQTIYPSSNATCPAVTTNVNELNEDQQFSIYPNPAVEMLNISSDLNSYSINIVSILGQIVQTNKCYAGNCQIDISNLLKGLYLVQVMAGGNMVCVQKVIRQ